ncbi:hypothetical protein [Phytohalomonas tamaricis]|uniref:hypothetical protein n=1 Tax=Phytohalomonas tamaricis TaxID=2081032 RepID=UPI000D0B29D9|nr:hypothetical protein [Phytohalomonas tamaricis]
MDNLSTTSAAEEPQRSHITLQHEPDVETLDKWKVTIRAWQQSPNVNVHMLSPLKAALTFRN